MLPQQTCWMPCHKHIEWCSRLDNLEPHFTLYLLLVLVERASLPSHKSWGRGLVTIFLKIDAVNFPRALGTVRIPDRDTRPKSPPHGPACSGCGAGHTDPCVPCSGTSCALGYPVPLRTKPEQVQGGLRGLHSAPCTSLPAQRAGYLDNF